LASSSDTEPETGAPVGAISALRRLIDFLAATPQSQWAGFE
jgi:hypothetical protein